MQNWSDPELGGLFKIVTKRKKKTWSISFVTYTNRLEHVKGHSLHVVETPLARMTLLDGYADGLAAEDGLGDAEEARAHGGRVVLEQHRHVDEGVVLLQDELHRIGAVVHFQLRVLQDPLGENGVDLGHVGLKRGKKS